MSFIVQKLVLASSSPYRRALLERLKIPFIWMAPEIDETPLSKESPEDLVMRLAESKAWRVAAEFPAANPAWVIGADQLCVCDGALVGKPGTRQRAVEQLLIMSGKQARFVTGLCILDTKTGRKCQGIEEVKVQYRVFDKTEIETYVDLEQPYDTAGSCKVEGLGIALITAIEDRDPTALIGLPLIRLTDYLTKLGLPILSTRRRDQGSDTVNLGETGEERACSIRAARGEIAGRG